MMMRRYQMRRPLMWKITISVWRFGRWRGGGVERVLKGFSVVAAVLAFAADSSDGSTFWWRLRSGFDFFFENVNSERIWKWVGPEVIELLCGNLLSLGEISIAENLSGVAFADIRVSILLNQIVLHLFYSRLFWLSSLSSSLWSPFPSSFIFRPGVA
jgi:hypothetical protein